MDGSSVGLTVNGMMLNPLARSVNDDRRLLYNHAGNVKPFMIVVEFMPRSGSDIPFSRMDGPIAPLITNYTGLSKEKNKNLAIILHFQMVAYRRE